MVKFLNACVGLWLVSIFPPFILFRGFRKAWF